MGVAGFQSTTVEAIAELIEILLKVFGRYAVIGAQQEGLQVADDDMNPGQAFARLLRGSNALGVMLGLADGPMGSQLFAAEQLTRRQVALHKCASGLFGDNGQLSHGDEASPRVPVLHRDQNRHLADSTPSLLSRLTPADQGIVNLDQIMQSIDCCPDGLWRCESCATSGGRWPTIPKVAWPDARPRCRHCPKPSDKWPRTIWSAEGWWSETAFPLYAMLGNGSSNNRSSCAC